MTNKYKAHQAAHFLYFTGKYSAKEIAEKAEVSERTICNWIQEGGWEKLRHYAMVMPMQILCNLMEQLNVFQKFIDSQSEAFRYPAIKEAEIQQKLINCIMKMQKFPTELMKSYGYCMCPISDIIDDDDDDAVSNAEGGQTATQAEDQYKAPAREDGEEWAWEKWPAAGVDNRKFYDGPRPKECVFTIEEIGEIKWPKDNETV